MNRLTHSKHLLIDQKYNWEYEKNLGVAGVFETGVDENRCSWSLAEGTYVAAGGVPAASATEDLLYTNSTGETVHVKKFHFQQDSGGNRVIKLYDGLTVAAGTLVWQATVTAATATQYTYTLDHIFATGIVVNFDTAVDTDFSYCLQGEITYDDKL